MFSKLILQSARVLPERRIVGIVFIAVWFGMVDAILLGLEDGTISRGKWCISNCFLVCGLYMFLMLRLPHDMRKFTWGMTSMVFSKST